ESIPKKVIQTLVCVGLVTISPLCFADEDASDNKEEEMQQEGKKPTREELYAPAFIQKISLMYGHLIQKSMNTPVLKMDSSVVIQGIKDAQEGKTAPMTDKEYEEAIGLIQQYSFEDMAKANLKEAESFLEKNTKE